MMNTYKMHSTTQRGLLKVKKARIVVIALLIAVAATIMLIDKKENNGVEENKINHEMVKINVPENRIPVLDNTKPSIPDGKSINLENSLSLSNAKQTLENSISEIQKNSKAPDVISPIKETAHVKGFSANNDLFAPAGSPKDNFLADAKKVEKVDMKKKDHNLSKKEPKKLPKKQKEPKEKESLKEEISSDSHIVRSGETLSKICMKHYNTTDWIPLFKANQNILSSPRDLKIGQKIKLISKKEFEEALAQVKGSGKRVSRTARTSTHSFVSTSSGKAKLEIPKENKDSQNRKVYIVNRGETLTEIAKRFGINFLKLYDLNKEVFTNIHNPNKLPAGTEIWVPMASPNH